MTKLKGFFGFQVAAQAATQFNPGVKIVPYHANIKDKRFDLKWFQTFDLVMNALDNLGISSTSFLLKKWGFSLYLKILRCSQIR